MTTGLWVLVAILLVGLLLRMPIGFSMLAAGIGYLIAKGQDVGLVAEQVGNGLYNSYVLLAVPLFVFAANLMNAGTVSERIFDDAGKVTGTRSKAAVLNAWTADPLERFSVQARQEMEARRQQGTPKMGVYDARAERAGASPQSVQQVGRVSDRLPPNRDR